MISGAGEGTIKETVVHISVLGLCLFVKGCPRLALTIFTTPDFTAVRLG